MAHFYDYDWFCDNCKKDTPHKCYTAGHERDSSYDWEQCKICKWKYSGIIGKYEEPDEFDFTD